MSLCSQLAHIQGGGKHKPYDRDYSRDKMFEWFQAAKSTKLAPATTTAAMGCSATNAATKVYDNSDAAVTSFNKCLSLSTLLEALFSLSGIQRRYLFATYVQVQDKEHEVGRITIKQVSVFVFSASPPILHHILSVRSL